MSRIRVPFSYVRSISLGVKEVGICSSKMCTIPQGENSDRPMILYPEDQKEAVIRKIRTLLSDPNTPRDAFSQLAKEGKIPSATIYQWKKEVEADLISQ